MCSIACENEDLQKIFDVEGFTENKILFKYFMILIARMYDPLWIGKVEYDTSEQFINFAIILFGQLLSTLSVCICLFAVCYFQCSMISVQFRNDNCQRSTLIVQKCFATFDFQFLVFIL